MRKRAVVLLAVPLVLASTVLVAAPAQAAIQPLFGTTVEVTAQPSSDSLLGETAYLPPAGGTVLVTLGAAQAANVDFELREGVTVIGSCTVMTGGTQCVAGVTVSAGSHPVTAYFTKSAVTVHYDGTIFSATDTAPTVSIEWQDASGNWVDGSGMGILLHGPTSLRCSVKNNSNTSLTFASFSGTITYSGGGPDTVSITGALAAGATGHYPLWSGSANQNPSVSCSGSVNFRDGTGNGGGNGGGVIALTGTFGISPQPAPGTTVTVTGTALVPPVIQSFPVTLDGVAVAASPGTTVPPDFNLAVTLVIPTGLAPGMHVIAVHSNYNTPDVVLAQFTFEVPKPALAATGVDATVPLLTGGPLLLLGVAFVLVARRRSRSVRPVRH